MNVLTSIKSSYVQNMIENMILTSYSDKSYLGASWGGCCKHANDVVWLVLKHKWTILVAWQNYLVTRHNFHVALGVTLHHDWKTSRSYDGCIFRLTTCQVLQHGAPFLLYSISTVKSCIQQTAFLDLAYCFWTIVHCLFIDQFLSRDKTILSRDITSMSHWELRMENK